MTTYTPVRTRLARGVTRAWDGYDPQGEVDLPGLTGSATAFSVGAAVVAVGMKASGRVLPERYAASDLLLGGVAVHKASRLLTKSSVASPLRAPFTSFEGAAGSGEHHESPREGHGARHAVGELVTCPFCMGVWGSSVFVAGLVVGPRVTRAAAAVLAVSALSDTLQHVYAGLRGD